MSMKAWRKIDKFFPMLVVVMLLLAALVILTFRGIFSAVTTAYEPEEEMLNSEFRIDKNKLEESHKAVFEREEILLETR